MTDQFPRGKLNADDEGQLQIRVGIQDRTVVVNFGKPVAWLGMDYLTAVNLAETIMRRAEEIKPLRSGKMTGRNDKETGNV